MKKLAERTVNFKATIARPNAESERKMKLTDIPTQHRPLVNAALADNPPASAPECEAYCSRCNCVTQHYASDKLGSVIYKCSVCGAEYRAETLP